MKESSQYLELISECRICCLWFLAPEKIPTERDAQIYTLDCIERYGDRAAFMKARKLKQWLSHHSSEAFAVC